MYRRKIWRQVPEDPPPMCLPRHQWLWQIQHRESHLFGSLNVQIIKIVHSTCSGPDASPEWEKKPIGSAMASNRLKSWHRQAFVWLTSKLELARLVWIPEERRVQRLAQAEERERKRRRGGGYGQESGNGMGSPVKQPRANRLWMDEMQSLLHPLNFALA